VTQFIMLSSNRFYRWLLCLAGGVEPDRGFQRLISEMNQRGGIMSGTQTLPVDKSHVSSSHVRQRLFAVTYLATCAVAMTGWMIGLGWAAIWLAERLFS
jgi:hypothetical protein